VSVAFTTTGQLVTELVSSNGVLTEFNTRGTFQLATGVRSASVAFGPQGEIMVVVFQDGRLVQFDASGVHLLASGVLSAGVGLNGGQEVVEVVFQGGTLVQFDATGGHQLATNVRSASVAFGPGRTFRFAPAPLNVVSEVLDVVFADGTLFQFDAAGTHPLAKNVGSAGVALDSFGQEVLAVLFLDRSLFQFNATGAVRLAASV
jgi:hypothetical protein